jgi:hypothetical protein
MCLFVLLLLQVALRRVLQVIDPQMTDAEAKKFVKCSGFEDNSTWWVADGRNSEHKP